MKKPKWTQAEKDYIISEFRGWLDCLYLTPCLTRYSWKEEDEEQEKGLQTKFKVLADWPYREAMLTAYPCVRNDDKDTQSMYLLHEAIHIVLSPMARHRYAPDTYFTDMHELVTDAITNYIWQARKYDEEKDTLIEQLKRKRKG